MNNKSKKIYNIITNLRPYIQQDGGDIEFIKLEDDIVYVRLLGACVGCGLIDMTITNGVEQIIKQDFPEIKKVIVNM
ncbi:NifU family protein [Spiroplasma endosymbiont of Amphibalanus improvisus]|uniref:NifU family protein n=1 Tax=Spiroplasma endosymbiont of Amphibalanus improvisus TaxID=3066327 RepID=UPI00313BC3EA